MSKEVTRTTEEYVDYNECLLSLGNNPEGLSENDVVGKREEFGQNRLTLEAGANPLLMFLRQFSHPLYTF